MKKKVFTVALIAVLGALATSCQKEEIISPVNTSENTSSYTLVYYVSGEPHTVTCHSRAEYEALFSRLMALAREGYSIVIYDARFSHEAMSKEKVTYTTHDEEDATKWSQKMVEAGYSVTVTFDEETGIYTCIAIK